MKMINSKRSKGTIKKITSNTKQDVAENKPQISSSLVLDDGYPFTTGSCNLLVSHFDPDNLNYRDYFSSASTAFIYFFKSTL